MTQRMAIMSETQAQAMTACDALTGAVLSILNDQSARCVVLRSDRYLEISVTTDAKTAERLESAVARVIHLFSRLGVLDVVRVYRTQSTTHESVWFPYQTDPDQSSTDSSDVIFHLTVEFNELIALTSV